MQNNVYITPSGMFNMPQFQNALEMMGADRIMYSADYPYYPNEGAREFLENAPISGLLRSFLTKESKKNCKILIQFLDKRLLVLYICKRISH